MPPDRADIREIASRLMAPARLIQSAARTALAGHLGPVFLLALISTQVLRDGREGGLTLTLTLTLAP